MKGKVIVVCTGDQWQRTLNALWCAAQYDQVQMLMPGAFNTWMDVDLDFFRIGMIKFL